MQLTVPEPHRVPLRKLVTLPREQKDGLAAALGEARPAANVVELAMEIRDDVDLDFRDLIGILGLLVSLYQLRATADRPLAELVNAIVDAAFSSIAADAELGTGARPELISFLNEVLQQHQTLGVTSKAMDVLLQDANPFSDSRIVTSVRPIFTEDGGDDPPQPSAALIIHNLKVTTLDGLGSEKQHFIALDTHDLRALKGTIDRALAKETSLRQLMDRTGLPFIDRHETR